MAHAPLGPRALWAGRRAVRAESRRNFPAACCSDWRLQLRTPTLGSAVPAPSRSPRGATRGASRHCDSGQQPRRKAPGECRPLWAARCRCGSADLPPPAPRVGPRTAPGGSVPLPLSLCRPATPSRLGQPRRVLPGTPASGWRHLPITQEPGALCPPFAGCPPIS